MKDCKRAVAEAGGITEAEADAIVQALGEAGRRLSAEGRALALDRELLRLAKGEADEARRAAAVARRRAAIAALKAAELRADIGRYRQEGLSPVVALKALMHGAERPVAGVRRSVWATAQAYKDRYVGGVMAAIARERPHLERQLGDEAFNERVAREMEEIGRKGGEPGVTGDADARWLAGLFARYGELSRRDRNRLGADVPARPGWTPHVHDPWRIVRAGEREWIGFTLDLLDLDRTFPGRSRKDAEDALSNVWRTIATGRDQSGPPEPGDLAGPAPGPANLAASLHKVRELHFKPGAWAAYNRRFGYGNLAASMFRHLHVAARQNGAMEVFGPNPGHMVKRLGDELSKAVRDDASIPAGKAKDLQDALDRVDGWASTRVMTGEADAPGNARWAAAGEGLRTWEAVSKLGGVVISAVADIPTLAGNLRFHGKPLLEAWAAVLRGYLRGRGEGEARHVAFLLGEGYDGLLDHMVSPYAANDGPTGMLSRAAVHFFRWSGLTGFTDVGRATGARIMAADMGHHAAEAWAGLPERYRNVLTLQGIGEARWEVLRAAAWEGEGGARYLTPERIAELPEEAMDPLIADELEAVRDLGGLPDDELPALPVRVDPDFRAEGPPRPAWPEGFPDAVVQRYGKLREVREHPDHAAAKAGDREAAARLVRDLVRDGPMKRLAKALGGREPVVLAVEAADGGNAIPGAYADELAARLGLERGRGVVQAGRSGHTDSAANARIVRRSTFEGPVERGRDYLIVDDHVTLGGTLADLRAHVEAGGGRVVLASTLSASPMSHRLALDAPRLAQLRNKLGEAEGWFRERFGHGYDGLTRAEAHHLLRFDTPDAMRRGLARAAARPLPEAAPAAPAADAAERARRLDQAVARLRRRARLRLELDVRRFYADEMAYGIVEVDDRAKKVVTAGLSRGTFWGETARVFMQFKAFPIAFQQRVLGRRVLASPHRWGTAEGLLRNSLHLGELVGTLWVAGMMATWAKDVARGQSPKSLVAADGGVRWQTLAAGLVQSGGLGIMGDFLFSEANRFGRSLVETASGPGVGELVGLGDLLMRLKSGEPQATRLLNQAIGATPFINLFYVRPALDFLVLNSLREGVSPGFLARQERRMRDDYGQERLWAPRVGDL